MRIYRIANVQVRISPSEAAIVSWALSPMLEYWCKESGAYERGGEQYSPNDMPKIDSGILTLSPVQEINEDLEYRITEQLYGMSLDGGDAIELKNMCGARTIATIRSLSKKLGWGIA